MNYQEVHQAAGLFLRELDEQDVESLRIDPRYGGVLPANIQEARIEFASLFAMRVYPYASIFLDDPAALNGESTVKAERFYERVGFEVRGGWMLGASDAIGAELECLAWLFSRLDEENAREFLWAYLLPWAPVFSVAVERNTQLEFYGRLAKLTREMLLDAADEGGQPANWDEDDIRSLPEELDLDSLVDYLTTPVRCGILISKQELVTVGREHKIPVAFGDRGLVLGGLLKGAGAQDRVLEVLDEFRQIVVVWNQHYTDWIERHPGSALIWRRWLERSRATERLLEEMKSTAQQAFLQKS